MMPGVHPLAAPISLGEIVGAGVPNDYLPPWDAATGRVFLYELTTFARGAGGSWIYTLGALIPLGTLPPDVSTEGEATLRFSDVGYISKPADTVRSTPFDGRVTNGLRLQRAIPSTPESARRVNFDIGSFAIVNADGELDSAVRGNTVDGRRVTVKLGLDTYGYDMFTVIFTGRIKQWSNNLSEVTVIVRDEGYRLEKPMQTDIFDGSGGYNGTSDLAGRPRPICFGIVTNISPPLINPTLLIYQVHFRSVQTIDAVYDSAALITHDADYADYAALAAAVVTPGLFSTCRALGLFRLGSTPSGLITADVHGDNTGGYVGTTASAAKRVFKDFGALVDADLDLTSITNFDVAIPGDIGWWQGTDFIDVADALDQILGHCNGWWGATNTGLFQIGTIAEPTIAAATLFVTEDDGDFEFLEPLAGTFPPRFRQRVGYQRNWTPQQETDLAGAVTAARRAFLAEEYRIVSSTDFNTQGAFQLATDPEPLQSLFYNSADATTLSASLLALYMQPRQTCRVRLDLQGFRARLGMPVCVTHRRLNNGTPTAMVCMGINILADTREAELILWG